MIKTFLTGHAKELLFMEVFEKKIRFMKNIEQSLSDLRAFLHQQTDIFFSEKLFLRVILYGPK